MPRYRNLALPCIGIEEDLFCRNETDFLILNYVFAPSCPPPPMCFLRAILRLSRSEGFPSGHHVFFSHFVGSEVLYQSCHVILSGTLQSSLYFFLIFPVQIGNFQIFQNESFKWVDGNRPDGHPVHRSNLM